jgi:hypothetical protein
VLPALDAQIVRGRPFRALFQFVGACAVFTALCLGISAWVNRGMGKRALAMALAYLTLALVVGVVLAIVSAFATARIDRGCLRFAVCGIPIKSIPLASITGFEQASIGRLKPVRIFYDGKWICPIGLLDPSEIADFLRANGIPESPHA